MTRTKLKDRTLPVYTRGEEIFNMVSHIVGGALGITATVLCVIMAAIHKNVYGIVGGAIYGFTMILLYTMSSIYHGLKAEKMAKKVFQIFDHCSIFILIAGTYTPIALSCIMRVSVSDAWWIFGIIWAAAVLGVVLNAIDLKSTKRISLIAYLLMGWCIVAKFGVLTKAMELGGIIFLILGGVAYSVGVIFYVLGKKKKYFHSVFHLFILLGSLLHFFCILFYVV